MNFEQLGLLLADKTAAWTLYHWAGAVFVLGFAGVLSKALYDELRTSKSLVNRFFIICATIAVLLFAAAAYAQLAADNGWHWL